MTPYSDARIVLLARSNHAGRQALREGIDALEANGAHIEVIETDGVASLDAAVAGISEQGFDRVLICGGDGTLNGLVRSMMKLPHEKRIPVGVVPMGTANDFASQSQIPPQSIADAVLHAANDPIRALDVGYVNGRPFINVVSGGAVARVTTETEPEIKARFGRFAYYLTGLRVAAELQAQTCRFVCDAFDRELDIYAFTVGNGRAAGGGFKVAPDAKVDDGFLDLLIVPAQTILGLSGLAAELLKPAPDLDGRDVVYLQTRSVVVECGSQLQVNIDGEPFFDTRFEFRVEPEAVQFAVAPEAPALS